MWTKLNLQKGSMIVSPNIKARLYFTYLKDKTELFLYVKPHDTTGSAMIYRRSPGDAAMNLRIQALLDNIGVLRSNLEIWILLYPPEINTTTLYAPSGLSGLKLSQHIRENVLVKLAYPINYDLENYILKKRDNGSGEDMLTITLLGKNVLSRIRSLLYKNISKVTFVGDGLQFLNMDEMDFPQTRGQNYEVILPYDEIYFRAGFRSGIHVESCGLPHACSPYFGRYKLDSQQVYLKCSYCGTAEDLPQIHPVVPKSEWNDALLTPAAFPTWFIARNSMKQKPKHSFTKLLQADQSNTQRIYPTHHYLNQ